MCGREVVKSLKLRTNSSSSNTAEANAQGAPEALGDGGAAGGGGGGGPGSSSNVSGVVVLSFTCSIPDRQRLMKAYERSPYPPMVSEQQGGGGV